MNSLHRKALAFMNYTNGHTDTVSGVSPLSLPKAKANSLQYVKAYGATEQSGTPTPDAPMDIVSNNGVLKYSKNLLDMATENIVLGKYINNSGVISDSAPNFYNSKYIPVVAGETYTWSTSDSIKYLSIMEYDSSKTFIKRTLFGSSQAEAGTSGTLTLDSTTAYVLLGSNMFAGDLDITLEEIHAVDWQFELGSVATTYRPYGQIYADGTVETIEDTIGNTAIAEMLLKVGNYQDVQSIIDGVVTRKVGVKVLDGTETWAQTTTNVVEAAIMTGQQYGEIAICSHLTYSSAGSFGAMPDNSFKTGTATYQNKIYCKSSIYATDTTTWINYLKTQYNAGTPIIVIYPLATPTTETVTGQTLQVQAGNNTLEITQASLNNLTLEAKYKRSK